MSQFGAMPLGAQRIPQPSPVNLFAMEEQERDNYLRSLGARNIEPPRVRSSHLKSLASGVVFPWDEMLAEQTELMVNCDAYGNTDPAAWQPTVTDVPFEPHDVLLTKGQVTALLQEHKTQEVTEFRVRDAVNATVPYPTDYPPGVVAVADMENLLTMLET